MAWIAFVLAPALLAGLMAMGQLEAHLLPDRRPRPRARHRPAKPVRLADPRCGYREPRQLPPVRAAAVRRVRSPR